MEEDEKKEHTALNTHNDLLIEIFAVVVGIMLLFRVIPAIFGSIRSAFISYNAAFNIEATLAAMKSVFFIFSNILSVFFFIGIVYAAVRIQQIDNEWRKRIYPEPAEPGAEAETAAVKNSRWDQVIAHIQSDNPSDWRLAILEADIVLDDILDKLGYVGDTIGDKLKAVDPAHFRTLDAAWEAHKIRNAIAHEGQDFVLTQREARRIIGLYETVFREFDFI